MEEQSDLNTSLASGVTYRRRSEQCGPPPITMFWITNVKRDPTDVCLMFPRRVPMPSFSDQWAYCVLFTKMIKNPILCQ